MMIGGKPVTVLTGGGVGAGKTVQLVSGAGGGQPMVVVQSGATPTASLTASDGPVTSDAALAQLAAEAGLMEGDLPQEGEGVTFQMAGGMMEGDLGPQVDGAEDKVDLGEFWSGGGMYHSQVDGDPGDEDEPGEAQQQEQLTGAAPVQPSTPALPTTEALPADQMVTLTNPSQQAMMSTISDHSAMAGPTTSDHTAMAGVPDHSAIAGSEIDDLEAAMAAVTETHAQRQLQSEPIQSPSATQVVTGGSELAVKQEKTAVADQADMDGASALAALASAASMASNSSQIAGASPGLASNTDLASSVTMAVSNPLPLSSPGLPSSSPVVPAGNPVMALSSPVMASN